jgi:TolB-like protein/DNA-binding winged helix-turn-helix (wHTH) protein/Flp pilus assembly protein TadD
MSDDNGHIERYGFDRFTLDPGRGTLQGPDGEIRLRPKSYELLLYLLRHPGRLVGREELLHAVWGHVAVTDDSVTQCLVEIRRALGADARRVVRTVPRRGYVLDVPVTRLGEPVQPPEPATTHADGPIAATAPPVAGARRFVVPPVAALAMGMLAVALAWWTFMDRDDAAPGSPAVALPLLPNSIAVLPFVDMSADRDQEYFGDGIAEEILNLLAQTPELKVIARTSSFSFKHEPADIATIAARLGVTHVLEGSVRRSGDRVRVTAQLVSGRDSAHLWSHAYDHELGDVFEVQAEIARAVADVLQATLLADASAAATATLDGRAYDHFLRARFMFNRRGHGDLERAREQLEAALAIEPGYAPAWALLSGVYNVQLVEGGLSREIGVPRRREAIERALALDPDLPEAHLRASAVRAEDGEFDQARQHLRIAQALDPDNPLLLGLSTGRALVHGQLEEAAELWQRIVAIDPLSSVSRFNRIQVLLATGRLEEARAELQVARELTPGRAGHADVVLAKILVLEGRHAEALALLAGAEEGLFRDGVLAMVHHALGQKPESLAAMMRLQALDSGDAALALAEVYAQRGEATEAFAWLSEARERFLRELNWGVKRLAQLANVSPFLRVLHDDPRWMALQAEARTEL